LGKSGTQIKIQKVWEEKSKKKLKGKWQLHKIRSVRYGSSPRESNKNVGRRNWEAHSREKPKGSSVSLGQKPRRKQK